MREACPTGQKYPGYRRHRFTTAVHVVNIIKRCIDVSTGWTLPAYLFFALMRKGWAAGKLKHPRYLKQLPDLPNVGSSVSCSGCRDRAVSLSFENLITRTMTWGSNSDSVFLSWDDVLVSVTHNDSQMVVLKKTIQHGP